MGPIHYNAQVPATNTALYTSSGATNTISSIVAWVAGGTAESLVLTVVRAISGNTETWYSGTIAAGNATSVLDDQELALEELVLDPGDALWGIAGAATSVNVLAFQ